MPPKKKEKSKRGLTSIITLKADEGTVEKLRELVTDFVAEKTAQGENVNGGHAQVIRRLIHEAHTTRATRRAASLRGKVQSSD